MKTIETNPLEPYVTLKEITAYVPGNPETYTSSKLVNAVCEALTHDHVLTGGKVAEYLHVDSEKLAGALELITGHSTHEIRAEVVYHKWLEYVREHPNALQQDIAAYVGFADYSALWKFLERWRRKNRETVMVEEMKRRRMKAIVRKVMPYVPKVVQKLYEDLPYPDCSDEEQEACISLLYRHSRDVADLALQIAQRHPEMNLNYSLIEIGALTHDVGILWTDAPSIHCHGTEPYIRHGELGKKFLFSKHQPRLAYIAARHTGAGISDDDIILRKLPLEFGAMPLTLEEKIICYADKFYSKSHPEHRKTMAEARASLEKFGETTLRRFDALVELFGEV